MFHGDSLEAAAPYTLGETLYFDLRATARPYLVSGFSSADFHSTWTVGESGRISLPLARLPRSDTLTVEMKFLSIMGGSQRLRVDCGGQTVFEGTVTDYTLRFSFPASLVQDQTLTLDFTYPDAISHLKAGLSRGYPPGSLCRHGAYRTGRRVRRYVPCISIWLPLAPRGMCAPMCSWGRDCASRGHEVAIVAFANFAAMAEEAGLGFYPLAGDVMDFMERIMKPGVVGAKFLRQVEESLRDVAPVLLRDLMEAFRGADAMICTLFGSTYYSVAEKYGIPVVQTQYFPMDPNRQMPISSAPAWKLGPAWNLATYRLGYLLIHLLEHRYLTAWREENHVTVPRIHGGPDYTLGGHTIPVIYAISPLVLPRPAQWGRNIHMSGFWVDEEAKPFVPPRELADFLAAGEKPVYIGFGSMVSGNMRKTFDVVMKAVRAAGLRVILDNGWSGAGLAGASNVFTLSSFVPHDWLFPQMRAVVHHGGAGTTAAGLRAGCPTLVIPFGGD